MTNFRALTGPGDTPYTNNSSYENDNGSDPSNPNLGWQSVGTTSLGGMDVNAAGTQLYVMDLQHRTLDILGVKPDGTWDGTLTAVAVPIPTDASSAADMQPFAVHYSNGLVYIGEVDSAQSTQNAAQLRGYVFTFNPATNTFNPNQVLEFSLNYARGASYGGSDDFHPWANTYQNINGTQSNDGATKYPQPMLTGIAFDAAGNMALGVRDRNGDQTTRFLESDPGHDPNTQEGISAGATLRAAPNATQTAWTLENDGSSGGVATGGAGSGFGPGGGMYYYQDNYDNSDTARNQNGSGHNDVTLGGVAQVPGFPDLVVTSFDPDQHSGSAPGQSASYRTGGIRWFHDGNDPLGNAGTDNKAYMLYSIDAPGTFGKADGIGNVVAQSFPAPLEIGDRVWEDTNGNGIQDAGEPSLPNVTVTLFDVTAGTTVGTTTTDANGDYLFNNSNVAGGLLPNHAYEVRIPTAQANLAGLVLTRANQGADPLVNSKAALTGGNAVITLTTGAFGQINHTFDAGFEPLAKVSGVVFDNSVEDDGVFHAATDPGINGVTVTLTGTDDLGNPVSLSTTTSTIAGQAGSYVFSGLRPSNAAGYTVTETGVGVPASFIDGKDSVPGSLGGKQANQTADQVTAIVVHANANGVNYDFGEIKPAQVAGTVFSDYNNDGTENGPDQGIAGVTITLTGTDGNGQPVNRTTTTAADGSYSFTGLLPGDYTITETQPAAYFDGKDILGSAGGTNTVKNQFEAIVLGGNQSGIGYNFAEVPMVDPTGVVYVDVNDNGILDPGEPGIPGVTVTLTGGDVFGQTITRTTLTDGDGAYQFAGLAPGLYSITETQPAGYVHGAEENGNPPAAVVVPHQFIGIDLTRAPFFGAGYNFGELLGGLAGGVTPPLIAPTGPDVDPTFISKTLLLGSGADGALASNVLYVNILYHQVLGRVADVGGLNAWVFQLDSGVSRTQVADEVWRSPEHRGLQVDQFYQTFFHRAADPAGRAVWVNFFLSGASETEVAADFLTSGEYQASHASDAAFAAGLYQDALNRPADGAGLAVWETALSSGASRQQIALDFLTSPESSQAVLDRLYAQFLGRPVDGAGEQAFLPMLEQGGQSTATVADFILSSDEFFNRFSSDN